MSLTAGGCRVLHQLLARRLAGHSKWANIKHIKAAKDAQKSALFTKLSRQMRVAIQEGGSPDPESNVRLAQVIEQAKRSSMPVASIQNTIQRCVRSKADDCRPVLLELRGPAGCFVLCQVLTDNLARCKQTLAPILKKHGVTFSDRGGRHLFEQKGVLEVRLDGPPDEEQLTEHAILSGAEDVRLEGDDAASFICSDRELLKVRAALEDLGYKVPCAEVLYLPKMRVQLEEAHLEVLSSLFDKLEAQEEVVKLYDNIG